VIKGGLVGEGGLRGVGIYCGSAQVSKSLMSL